MNPRRPGPETPLQSVKYPDGPERYFVREWINSDIVPSDIHMWSDAEGWAATVGTVTIAADSPAELFQILADIMRES